MKESSGCYSVPSGFSGKDRTKQSNVRPSVISVPVLGYDFPANLMLLPFNEFDVILGMDW
ncbi:hypothetical protein EPI10_030836 [Gossypium australe]|uniref:Uncharacterized protein n=1 Tax=Gossypium australe TaxID=47621 RepID=A0A5B6WZN9_9ROSI|nr:hypothetical protein EPI10_030836 [Gossypium australe]